MASMEDMYGAGEQTAAPQASVLPAKGVAKTVSLDEFYSGGGPSDSETAAASLKSIGAKEFADNNMLMQMGASIYKHLTGQHTEGSLSQDTPETKALKVRLGMEQPDVPWYKTPAKLVERFAENPQTTLVELGKGILYDPELLAVGALRAPSLAGRIIKGAAVGGGIGAAQSLAQQSLEKDTIDPNAVAGGAFGAAVQGGVLAGALGGKSRSNVNKIPDGDVNTTTDSRGQPWKTSAENPEASPPEPEMGTLFGQDARWNAERRAYDLMQRGAGKKEVDAVVKQNPLVGKTLDEMMSRRQDARQGPMGRVVQGEVLGPEEDLAHAAAANPDPHDFHQVVNGLADEQVKRIERQPLRSQSGEIDPDLLKEMGVGAAAIAAGGYAFSSPDHAKQVAEAAGLIGMALTTKGKLPPEVTDLTARIAEKSNSDIALAKLIAIKDVYDKETPQDVTHLITKPLQEFHKTLGEKVQERIQQTQEKVAAYPDWKFEEGDRVMSPKTGGVYKITGKTWNPVKDRPQYFYESTLPQETEGWSKGTFDAEKAHETLTKFTGPQRNQSGKVDPQVLFSIAGLTLGAAAGMYLDPEHKITGVVLGALAGVGLSKVKPSTAGDLLKKGYDVLKNPENYYDKRIRINELGDEHEVFTETAKLVNAKFADSLKKLVPDIERRNRIANEIERPEIVQALNVAKAAGQADKAKYLADYLKGMDETPLTATERDAMKQSQQFFDGMKKAGFDAEVLKTARENYVTHMWEWGMQGASKVQQALARAGVGGNGMSGSTPYAKARTVNTMAEGKFAGLQSRTEDIAQIVEAYGNSLTQAIANKKLIEGLKTAKTEGGVKLIMPMDKAPHTYAGINSPQFSGMRVHPDIAPSLRFLFDQKEPNVAGRAIEAVNTAIKRTNVSFSLFHIKSLIDASLGASNNPLRALTNLKGYASGKNALLQELNKEGISPLIDMAVKGGLKISLERGASAIEELSGSFYSVLQDTQKFLDDSIPHAGKPIEGLIKLNHAVDTLTWGRMHTGMKLNVFAEKYESILENNVKAHNANPEKVSLLSNEDAAKIAASFTNDTFGGLNWRRVAEDMKHNWTRDVALWALKPSNRRVAQLLMFAPDWTMSTVRAVTGALGKGSGITGLTSARTLADLHRQYMLRSAAYYMLIGNAINYSMSGHYTWDNKDPTRLDMGDGRTMQWSKHTMEPVHWATQPGQQVFNKLGFVPKQIMEQAAHVEYLSAHGKMPPMKDSRIGHLLKGVAPISGQTSDVSGMVASTLGVPMYGMTPQQKATADLKARMNKLQGGR
jgi:hypothetical protein